MSDTNATPQPNEPVETDAPAEEIVAEPVTETPEGSVQAEPVVGTPEPLIEPAEPAATMSEGPVVDSDTEVESTVADQPVEESVIEGETTEVAPAPPVQTVYVTAPNPPRKKGNRGVGSLYALLAAVVFAAVYAGIAALLILFVRPDGVADALGTFLAGPLFYIPVLAFLVITVLWVLLANRAGWWAWVIGSIVVAVVVYFASIGALLLMKGGLSLTASEATKEFYSLAANPALIAAALIAREVAIWFGAAIAMRGRRVRERNYAAWEEFEREEAEKRARFGGRATA
jgi:hypothetical protein